MTLTVCIHPHNHHVQDKEHTHYPQSFLLPLCNPSSPPLPETPHTLLESWRQKQETGKRLYPFDKPAITLAPKQGKEIIRQLQTDFPFGPRRENRQ